MHVNGEFQYTYAMVRRILVASIRRSRLMRIGGVLVIVSGTGSVLLGRTSQWWLPVLGLFITFAPELLALLSWVQQRRAFAIPVHYTVTGTGAEIRSLNTTVQVMWAGLSWVRTLPDMWLLRNGPVTIAIPRRAFAPADQVTVDAIISGVKAG